MLTSYLSFIERCGINKKMTYSVALRMLAVFHFASRLQMESTNKVKNYIFLTLRLPRTV